MYTYIYINIYIYISIIYIYIYRYSFTYEPMLLLYCNFGLSSAMAAPDPAGPAGEVLSNWDGAGGQGEIFCSKCRRYGYRWYLYVYIYVCMYMYVYVY